jgi:hypothetical protein
MMKPVSSLAALGAIAASIALTGCATPQDSQAAYTPPEVREYATGSRLPVRKLGTQNDAKAGDKVSGEPAPAAGG